MQVTLALQPLFKRSVSYVNRVDSDLAERVAAWGYLHEFADILWLPQDGKVVYRQDDRVDVSAPGNGLTDIVGLRPYSIAELVTDRIQGNCSRAPAYRPHRAVVHTRLLTESLLRCMRL